MMNCNEAKNLLVPSFNAREPWNAEAKKKAAILMSGGVDSGVTAALIKKAGYSAAGVTMNFLGKNSSEKAEKICCALGIPHFSVNLGAQFHELVLTPFIESYRTGITPNPCSVCNESLKLGLLADIVTAAWGSDFMIATGHYAKRVDKAGGIFLARADERKKDQSYFLAGVRKEIIERLLLPLGKFKSKELTRAVASAAGLAVANEPESMDICFAEDGGYRKMLKGMSSSGPIVSLSGKVIGKHTGISSYTVGQRKGLGIASPRPLYVAEIRPESNTIVAAYKEHIMATHIRAVKVNALIESALKPGGSGLYGKIRSQSGLSRCKVEGRTEDSIAVVFDEPQFAPTCGQRLVLYTDEGYVAGGGIIVTEGFKSINDLPGNI
jgi:tRNA-specific 2-thiouridylase